MPDDEMLPPEISAKATSQMLDTISTILSAEEATKTWMPVKGLLIYVYMKDDGQEQINSFGTDGVWSMEAIGMCEVAKMDLLASGKYVKPSDDI